MADPSKQQQPGDGKSSSKTVTDTIVGEHEHTIVGYSLIKGIGDGEPVASERFVVGGHEWVLLFYPDGKRSASNDNQLPGPPPPHMHGLGPGALPQALPAPAAAPQVHAPNLPPRANAGGEEAAPAGNPPRAAAPAQPAAAPGAAPAPAALLQPNNPYAAMAGAPAVPGMPVGIPPNAAHLVARRDPQQNEYAALFVALIGETDNPQGVVNTTEGRVVRAFHKFTLVDQSGQGRDLTKGRRRDQGAVKISCARQDPNARNCHGYRKFVRRAHLEDPTKGFLANDTIVIRYTIELVVSSGGALSRNHGVPPKPALPLIPVPPSSLGRDLVKLLDQGSSTDVTFMVEGEQFHAHRMLLQARSPVFQALLSGPMREGKEGEVEIQDIRAPVFKSMLHFVYSDSLPEEDEAGPGPSQQEGASLDINMAQHLLVAADRFELPRLRAICERRLVNNVEVENVATTLALAEQNNAEELKRACLEFVSKHLPMVMSTDGYRHMVTACPQLQEELLTVMAAHHNTHESRPRRGMHGRPPMDEAGVDEHGRRVRMRKDAP